MKVKTGTGHMLLQALFVGSWVSEGIGELAAGIAILFIFRHFSPFAFAAFIGATAFTLLGVPTLSFVGLIIYAIVNQKELMKKQAARTAPVTQEKEVVDVEQRMSATDNTAHAQT